ncbi:multifunctional CCA addition/repair protein [Thiomicrospira microaerophila]|uniref:multifunctional CCA addition/repair protein n=1 Tax=Thiomicrospira microaerophila TaxID=406020 RepID=UPI00200DBA35|nr:multifunctional CCA addition/repair protein [Thiomicrospira microaerophila]UQB42458.1 multifunctional CCA addition/repair protein [Thiomicrospira microaerophila]
MQVYLVGGAVRDALLGIPIQDRDWVVVGASAEDLLALGCKQVGSDFPVFLHPETQEEYALARTERKSGRGYHGFEIDASPDVTLEEDLYRRDLTINAMALTNQAELIDPYGGKQDLEQRILRHVSPAFVEDPLRVLRVARFKAQLAQFEFQLANETRELMRQMVNQGELSDLVAERVWQEVSKALMTSRPGLFFACLKEVGALSVLFPALNSLFKVPQSEVHHPEGDAGVHTLMVVDAAARLSSSLDVRFAALVHDLGKSMTNPSFWPQHPDHEKAGLPIVEEWGRLFRVPKTTLQLALRATEWHGWIHKGGLSMSLADMLKVLKGCDAFRQPERFEQLLTVCEADHLGRKGFEDTPYPQKDFWLGALEACSKVDASILAADGLTGEKMAQAIEQQRLARLDNFKTQLLIMAKSADH